MPQASSATFIYSQPHLFWVHLTLSGPHQLPRYSTCDPHIEEGEERFQNEERPSIHSEALGEGAKLGVRVRVLRLSAFTLTSAPSLSVLPHPPPYKPATLTTGGRSKMELLGSQAWHRPCPHTFCTGRHLGPEGTVPKGCHSSWFGLTLGGRREEIKSCEG